MFKGMPKMLLVLFLVPFGMLLAKTAVVGMLMMEPVQRSAGPVAGPQKAAAMTLEAHPRGTGEVKGPF